MSLSHVTCSSCHLIYNKGGVVAHARRHGAAQVDEVPAGPAPQVNGVCCVDDVCDCDHLPRLLTRQAAVAVPHRELGHGQTEGRRWPPCAFTCEAL